MTNKKGYIFKITNNQNEKVFIGYNSSIPLNLVISRDKSNIKNGVYKEKKLYAAMRAIGFINFNYTIIMEIDVSNGNEELLKWYRIVMKEYDSIENGYNEIRGNYQGRYGNVHNKKEDIKVSISNPSVIRFESHTVSSYGEFLNDWISKEAK